MHTLKRLKDGIFNSSVDPSKPHGQEKKEEKKGKKKVFKSDKMKDSTSGALLEGADKTDDGAVNTCGQDPRIGIHVVLDKKPLAERILRKKRLKKNRLTFMNMDIKEKRQLYRCGENFFTNEQIPNWAEASNLLEALDDDHSDRVFELESAEIFQPDVALNGKVALWYGDITTLEIDVIVNSTNSILLLEARGVNKAIREAAGPELELELQEQYLIEEDSVFKTNDFLMTQTKMRETVPKNLHKITNKQKNNRNDKRW